MFYISKHDQTKGRKDTTDEVHTRIVFIYLIAPEKCCHQSIRCHLRWQELPPTDQLLNRSATHTKVLRNERLDFGTICPSCMSTACLHTCAYLELSFELVSTIPECPNSVYVEWVLSLTHSGCLDLLFGHTDSLVSLTTIICTWKWQQSLTSWFCLHSTFTLHSQSKMCIIWCAHLSQETR